MKTETTLLERIQLAHSHEYERAMAESKIAIRAFETIKNDYRNRLIGDAEYLSGRKAYYAAIDRYDTAHKLATEIDEDCDKATIDAAHRACR